MEQRNHYHSFMFCLMLACLIRAASPVGSEGHEYLTPSRVPLVHLLNKGRQNDCIKIKQQLVALRTFGSS